MYSNGMVGASASFNVMPGEWGAAYRASSAFDATSIGNCLFDVIVQEECADNTTIKEQSLLITREFDSGTVIVGVGLGEVSYEYFNGAKPDKVVMGIPLAITVRTEAMRYLGLSASLMGNLNEAESYCGLNFQIEIGERYRAME